MSEVVPEGLGGLIDKGFFVADDIDMSDGGKDSYLIECILFFFVG